jgi:hypothetical protein
MHQRNHRKEKSSLFIGFGSCQGFEKQQGHEQKRGLRWPLLARNCLDGERSARQLCVVKQSRDP